MHRYSLLYFFLFFAFGAYVPWMPAFLDSRGMSAAGIALALASVQVARALLPPAWGWLADRLQAQRGIFVVSCGLAGATLLGLLLPGGPEQAVGLLLLYAVVMVPSMPLLEALTLEGLGEAKPKYGQVRLWGSLAFILSSWGLGWAIPRWGVGALPWTLALPLLAAAVFGRVSLAARAPTPAPAIPTRLPWRRLTPLLVAAALSQASHGPYYAFFTLQQRERGVSAAVIGALWALGVVAEILIMAAAPRWLPRLGATTALRWALVLTAVRWLALAGADSLWLVTATQVLHAASYGILHLTTLQLVDELTPPRMKAFGQAVLSAWAYGVGIGGGLALAGLGVETLGHTGLYLAACVTALAAWGAAALLRPGSQGEKQAPGISPQLPPAQTPARH